MKNSTLNINIVIFYFCIFYIYNGVAFAQSEHPPFVGNNLNAFPCKGKRGAYGPFDYTKRSQIPSHNLNIVEGAHFTPEVESLVRGNTTSLPYGDIAYTLQAWPNHHRALYAISRYHLRLKLQNKNIPIAAECWFQRALIYSSEDATTYMLYGSYLQKSNKPQSAKTNYLKALELEPENQLFHYNYGLLLVELKQYDKAREHAKAAYRKPLPLSGLRDKLKKAGYWP